MADIKMKDIAAEVGVSVVTVSNALSGKKGVSEDVRKLVEQTAREMGYDSKKHNKKDQAKVIGVIASEKYITVGNSFYWAMYQNVAYEAAKNQNVTMLEILTFSMEEKEELPKLMQEKAIAGLIIIGWMSRSYVEKIVRYADFMFTINPEVHKFIGRVFYNNAYNDQAMFFLDRAKSYFYHDPELHYLLAFIYYNRNEYKNAEKSLENCLCILPEYFPALNLLKKIKQKNEKT